MPRQITDLVVGANPIWANRKVEGTATFLAESHGSVGAWHDNLDANGAITSRDCGIPQINIRAQAVGTSDEFSLRTESLDVAVYIPVAAHACEIAARLYQEPWIRDGQTTIREWQPWVAYTSGWALYPEAWVWHRAEGKPIGPWIATGRYLHQAIRAVANWHLYTKKDLMTDAALAEGERLANIYGVTKGSLMYSSTRGVYWRYPPVPNDPPVDPVAEYPQKNDGRSYIGSL